MHSYLSNEEVITNCVPNDLRGGGLQVTFWPIMCGQISSFLCRNNESLETEKSSKCRPLFSLLHWGGVVPCINLSLNEQDYIIYPPTEHFGGGNMYAPPHPPTFPSVRPCLYFRNAKMAFNPFCTLFSQLPRYHSWVNTSLFVI